MVYFRIVRHVRMHVHKVTIVDRRHADHQLRDVEIVIAIEEGAIKNSQPNPAVNFQFLDGFRRRFSQAGLLGARLWIASTGYDRMENEQ